MTETRTIVGDAKCPCCGTAGQVKLTAPTDKRSKDKQPRCYFYCKAAWEGGCVGRFAGGSEKFEAWLCGHITRWRDQATRSRLGLAKGKADPEPAAEPAAAPEPAADPEPAAAPPPARKTEKKVSFWDREII